MLAWLRPRASRAGCGLGVALVLAAVVVDRAWAQSAGEPAGYREQYLCRVDPDGVAHREPGEVNSAPGPSKQSAVDSSHYAYQVDGASWTHGAYRVLRQAAP